MSNPLLNKIKTHPVFTDLEEDELLILDKIVDRIVYEPGAIVFDASKTPSFLYYIESGNFILHLSNNDFIHLNPGQLMGEIGVINNDFRSGTVTATEHSSVIRICGSRLFKSEYVPAAISLKVVRALSKQITNYLRSQQQVSTKELIALGENDQVEFKSSLRWNLYTRKKDKAMETAVIKTLAGFMNSEGGMLLIGVADNGKILGLKSDQFQNSDKALLHLTSLIKSRIGALFLKFIHFSIEEIEKKQILRIDCLPATRPAYVAEGKEDHFYIRTGPSTTNLNLRQVTSYIHERFNYNNLYK